MHRSVGLCAAVATFSLATGAAAEESDTERLTRFLATAHGMESEVRCDSPENCSVATDGLTVEVESLGSGARMLAHSTVSGGGYRPMVVAGCNNNPVVSDAAFCTVLLSPWQLVKDGKLVSGTAADASALAKLTGASVELEGTTLNAKWDKATKR